MSRPSLTEMNTLEDLAAWAASNHQGGFLPADWMPLLLQAQLIWMRDFCKKLDRNSCRATEGTAQNESRASLTMRQRYKGAAPGPWRVHPDDDGCPIVGGDGERICDLDVLHAESEEEFELQEARSAANARLIADAPALASFLAKQEERLLQIEGMLEAGIAEHEEGDTEKAIVLMDDARIMARQTLSASPFGLFGLAADSQNDNQPAADERRAG